MTRLALTLFLLLSLLPCLTADKSVDRAKARFLNWDINRDGKLLYFRNFLPSLKRNFQRVDQNKDGSISLSRAPRFSLETKERIRPKKSSGYYPTSLTRAAQTQGKPLTSSCPTQSSDNKKLPLVVWIHGGGWKNGDKQSGLSPQPIARPRTNRAIYRSHRLAYRLSGEAQLARPDSRLQSGDPLAAWHMQKNMESPRTKIIAWGSSAGGHLVSMLGVSHGVKELEGKIGESYRPVKPGARGH